jgi:hypothetical protein
VFPGRHSAEGVLDSRGGLIRARRTWRMTAGRRGGCRPSSSGGALCRPPGNATARAVAKAIQDKLDRLDEAFLFERSIDIETYDRHAEKLREELTLARIDRHSGQLEELDVEGILAFAERVLPRAADLWVQASLEQR